MLRWTVFTVVAISFGQLLQLVPGGSRIPFGKILLPIGFLALLAQPGLQRRFNVFRTTQARMFGLLVFAMCLSVPFSLYRGGAFQTLIHFGEANLSLVLFVALACADEADLVEATRSVVVGGGILGLAVVGGVGYVAGGRAWAGSTFDSNDLALLSVVIFPLAIWMLRDRTPLWRWVGAASAMGAVGAVFLSASRGGMLGFATVVILLGITYWKRAPRTWRVIAVAMIVVGVVKAPSEFWKRMDTLRDPGAGYNVTSDIGRLAIWKRGLGYFASRPLTGVGLGEFGAAEGQWAVRHFGSMQGFKWSVAHSIWIEVLAEVGIFGIIGFVGLYVPTLRDTYRLTHRLGPRAPPGGQLESFGVALCISIVGFFVSGTFLASAYSSSGMMLAALGMSYSRIIRARRPSARRTPLGRQRRQYAERLKYPDYRLPL